MRLYFEIEKTDPLQESLCEVACNYDEIVICYFDWCYENPSNHDSSNSRFIEFPVRRIHDLSKLTIRRISGSSNLRFYQISGSNLS